MQGFFGKQRFSNLLSALAAGRCQAFACALLLLIFSMITISAMAENTPENPFNSTFQTHNGPILDCADHDENSLEKHGAQALELLQLPTHFSIRLPGRQDFQPKFLRQLQAATELLCAALLHSSCRENFALPENQWFNISEVLNTTLPVRAGPNRLG